MQYTVTTNVLRVIGPIWQPGFDCCAMEYALSGYDLENAKDDTGAFTRESVQRWVDTHTGDFQSITDWSADFGADEFVSDWSDEESEWKYNDATYGDD